MLKGEHRTLQDVLIGSPLESGPNENLVRVFEEQTFKEGGKGLYIVDAEAVQCVLIKCEAKCQEYANYPERGSNSGLSISLIRESGTVHTDDVFRCKEYLGLSEFRGFHQYCACFSTDSFLVNNIKRGDTIKLKPFCNYDGWTIDIKTCSLYIFPYTKPI